MNRIASIAAKIWQRLSNRTKLPRRLWYPPAPVDIYDQDLWQKQFDDVCTTIRRSMFGIIGYSAFCLVALGQPDAELLREAAVQLPIVNTKVSIAGFMIIGPLVLVGLSAYLHIFIGRWVKMKWGKSMDSLSPPYIFNLPDKSAAVISAFLFYWLPPIVLAAFVFKGQPYNDFEYQILQVSLIVTMLFVLLAIRRCPDARRKFQNPVLWLVLLVLFVSINIDSLDGPERRLNLIRANLIHVSLRDVNLSRARLITADLTDADLTGANLTRARLFDANLTRANLTRANLSFANLSNIGTNLAGANLSDANLTDANLTGANLSLANLNGTDLRGAIGLNCEKLATATNWQYAFRDPEFSCGKPIPERSSERD